MSIVFLPLTQITSTAHAYLNCQRKKKRRKEKERKKQEPYPMALVLPTWSCKCRGCPPFTRITDMLYLNFTAWEKATKDGDAFCIFSFMYFHALLHSVASWQNTLQHFFCLLNLRENWVGIISLLFFFILFFSFFLLNFSYVDMIANPEVADVFRTRAKVQSSLVDSLIIIIGFENI